MRTYSPVPHLRALFGRNGESRKIKKILKTLLITGPLITGVFLWSSLNVADAANVNCNQPNASVQNAVDNADGPTTIKINGTCFEDVTITKDDIT